MPSTNNSTENIRNQFVELARMLSNHFPEVDLRFNLQSGTTNLRCLAPEFSTDAVELTLGRSETEQILHQAIFAIKEMIRHFDA